MAARHVEITRFSAEPQALREAIGRSMYEAGLSNVVWAEDGNSAYGHVPLGLVSWGERVTVSLKAGGEVEVASEFVMPLQVIDLFGRNQQNCRKVVWGVERILQQGAAPAGPAPVAPPAQTGDVAAAVAAAEPGPAAEPGWYTDPLAHHQMRYWDGGKWTDYVADNQPCGPA